MRPPRSAAVGAVLAVALWLLLCAAAVGDAAEDPAASRPSLVLITLDTTRSDALGVYGSQPARTPSLDSLAGRGTRYRTAVAPSPLTLPAHTTLLTGLDPPEHGVRDNGAAALGPDVPTLATVLTGRGWATAAFVSSRVLDRRFGLGRGFATYDDRMAAERVCEQGYPERGAREVTDAAIGWLAALPSDKPYLLWVHYYDPHAPYHPPAAFGGSSTRADYAGEVAFMDQQIGRLLAALPGPDEDRITVAVGDHGEALGEHGERTHGIFLYRGVLEVPLILAGWGVPTGAVVEEVVGTRSLTPTLLRLAGAAEGAADLGPSLPGIPAVQDSAMARPVYSETLLPASAYGWAALKAITDARWRLVVAPRTELYDLEADPGESNNLIDDQPAQAQLLALLLQAREREFRRSTAVAAELDPDLAAALRSLGYVTGGPTRDGDGIDPKDGVRLLAEMDEAKGMAAAGRHRLAVERLQALAARNPSNIPLLTELAAAELAAGDQDRALSTYHKALSLDQGSEFLRLNLAHALRQANRLEEARQQYRAVLEVDPRSAPAWLHLADLATIGDHHEEPRAVLHQAVEQGADSVLVLLRLARLEIAAGSPEAAETLLERAVGLDPGWAAVWLEWGRLAEARGELERAVERCTRAEELEPANAEAALCIGRVLLTQGEVGRARHILRRASVLGRNTPAEKEAERLLEESRGPSKSLRME